MPIKKDSTKFSFEFMYEWESPNGEHYSFPVKYLHGMVQIYLSEGHAIELPSEMFTEIANFLHSQTSNPRATVDRGHVSSPISQTPNSVKISVPLHRSASESANQEHNPLIPPQSALTKHSELQKEAEISSLTNNNSDIEKALTEEEILKSRKTVKNTTAKSVKSKVVRRED